MKFNAQDYRNTLIKGGVSPDAAADLSARMAEDFKTRDDHGKGHASAKSKKTTERKEETNPSNNDKQKSAVMAGDSGKQEKASILNQSSKTIAESQVSLFDVAPYSDSMRILPNDFARSALFTVRNKRTPRAALQSAPIFSVNSNVKITYTGIELRADDDELVWQQVLEYTKRTSVDQVVEFSFYTMCGDLGWPRNGRYYKRAEACLSRLQASAIHINSERTGTLESISLIHRFRVLDRGKRTARCMVGVDGVTLKLFAGSYYSCIVWDEYKPLTPIARRLCDWFTSHQTPFPLKLETFRLMCGSDSARPNKWREQVRAACKEICETNRIKKAWVSDDKIFCEK